MKPINLKKLQSLFQNKNIKTKFYFEMPCEVVEKNLKICKLCLDNIKYDDNFVMTECDIEAFVEPFDDSISIPDIYD